MIAFSQSKDTLNIGVCTLVHVNCCICIVIIYVRNNFVFICKEQNFLYPNVDTNRLKNAYVNRLLFKYTV